MTFAPEAPPSRVPPTQVRTDTWVIHQVQEALGAPLTVCLNSMVIAGSELAIIDTGSINNRDAWLGDVLGIVDPGDVPWVRSRWLDDGGSIDIGDRGPDQSVLDAILATVG